MYPPTEVAKTFLECFDKSAIKLFRDFLATNASVRKWMIAADFSLHNKERPYDCFAFTIFPYDALPADIEKDVTRAIRNDLKKSKELSADGVAWLRDPRRFHIVITTDGHPGVFGGEGVPLNLARGHIDQTLQTIINFGLPPAMIARWKQLKQDAQANGFNVALLADIWLLGIWFGILTLIIGRDRPSEIIGWFPDRDSMTNYCQGVWQDYAFWNTGAFAETFAVDLREARILIAAPDRSGTKEHMWFDYMIRGCDWLAGTVAAWDRNNDKIPGEHAKYRQVLEDVIARADNIVILHLDMAENMQFRRVVATPKITL